jgi:hypothetical protein
MCSKYSFPLRSISAPRIVAMIVLSMSVGLSLLAQSTPHHSHSPSAQIDGAQYPELIPDNVAYRLYFLAVAELPGAQGEAKARQQAHLTSAGIGEDEIPLAVEILGTFKTEFTSLVDAYNKTAEDAIARHVKPDYPSFKNRLDALVETTRIRLRSSLTVQTMNNLDAHIQHEKRNMKIDALEAAQ